jgi:capsule polysaccharide modification protein KpsS
MTELIPFLYFKVIKDKIASFIANERDNQIEIARSKGYSNERIRNEIDFTIFTDKFKPLSKEDLPCVIVDIQNTVYPPTMQYASKVYANSTLQFYLFSKGYSEEYDIDTNNKEIINDDKNSSVRLDYLLSQIIGICNSEKAYNFGTEDNRNRPKHLYIDKKAINNWKRILMPEEINQTETTLAYLLEYNISYFEYTEQITGKELKEIYSTLKIRDEFINPFLDLLIKK